MSTAQGRDKISLSTGSLVLLVSLCLGVLVSALGVVASTHQVRKQVDQLEILRREATQLQVEWGQYLLEQSTWAAYGRVERIAADELNLRIPDAGQVVVVRP